MPYRAPDISPLVSVLMQAKAAKERKEQLAYERERQGRIDSLAMQDREHALEREKLADTRLARQEKQQDAAIADKEAERIANVRRFAANAIRQNPASAQGVSELLTRNNAHEGLDLLGGAAGPEDVERLVMQLDAGSSGRLGAPDMPKQDAGPAYDEIAKRVFFGKRLQRGMPGFEEAYAQEAAAEHAREMQRRRAGATSVNVGTGGGVGLTTAREGTVQGEVMDADKALAQLGRIDKLVGEAGGAGSLASLTERGRAAIAGAATQTPLAGAVSPQTKAELEKRRTAESAIATFRNQIFNKLSGAAVSESERARLMQSVPDVGDPEPEFNAKMAAWRDNLEFERKYGMDALVNGLQTGDMSAPKGGAGPKTQTPTQTAQGPDRLRRKEPPPQSVTSEAAAKMRQSGASPLEAISQLESAGKISPQKAQELRAKVNKQRFADARRDRMR